MIGFFKKLDYLFILPTNILSSLGFFSGKIAKLSEKKKVSGKLFPGYSNANDIHFLMLTLNFTNNPLLYFLIQLDKSILIFPVRSWEFCYYSDLMMNFFFNFLTFNNTKLMLILTDSIFIAFSLCFKLIVIYIKETKKTEKSIKKSLPGEKKKRGNRKKKRKRKTIKTKKRSPKFVLLCE